MKLILWPFKFLLKFLIVLIVILVILGLLLYKNVEAPVIDNNNVNTIEQLVTDSVDNFLDENNNDKVLTVSVDPDTVNKNLKESLMKSFNPSSPDNVYEDKVFNMKGVWIVYNNGMIDINVSTHFNNFFSFFKTRVLIRLKVSSVGDDVIFKVHSVKVGNLPVTWLVKLFPSMIPDDAVDKINDSFKGYGTFSKKELQLSLSVNELLKPSNATDTLVNSLLPLLISNDTLKVEVTPDNKHLNISLDLNQFYYQDPLYFVKQEDKIHSQNEFDAFLQQKALEGFLLGNNKIIFDQSEFNQILDFLILEGSLNNELQKLSLVKDYQIKVLVPFVDLTDTPKIVVPIYLGSDSAGYYLSAIELEFDLEKSNNDLIIEFKSSAIGNKTLDEKFTKEILSIVDNTITDSKLVYTNFFDELAIPGLTISNINITNNEVVVIYDSQLNINDILTTFTSDFVLPNDLNDLINTYLDNSSNQVSNKEITNELLEYLYDSSNQVVLDDLLNLLNISI